MLVTSSSVQDHIDIVKNLSVLRSKAGENIDVYTVEAGSVSKNGIKLSDSRKDLLDKIAESNESLILIHYDTLAEGIDISSLTGLVVLRKVKKYKLLQLIGRIGRPASIDLDKNGNIIDINNRSKPCSVVTIPVIDDEYLCGIDAKDIANTFIEGGYNDISTSVSIISEGTLRGKRAEEADEADDHVYEAIKSAEIDRDVAALIRQGVLTF